MTVILADRDVIITALSHYISDQDGVDHPHYITEAKRVRERLTEELDGTNKLFLSDTSPEEETVEYLQVVDY